MKHIGQNNGPGEVVVTFDSINVLVMILRELNGVLSPALVHERALDQKEGE